MKEQLILIAEQPRRLEQAAAWFHQKWGIPPEAYTESMRQSLTGGAAVPQWLIAVQGERIVGGLGSFKMIFTTGRTLPPTSAPSMWSRTAAGRDWPGGCWNGSAGRWPNGGSRPCTC